MHGSLIVSSLIVNLYSFILNSLKMGAPIQGYNFSTIELEVARSAVPLDLAAARAFVSDQQRQLIY
jgi:hypothetical protein